MKVLRPSFSARPNKKYSRSSEAQVLENGKFENTMNGWFDNTMIYSWIVIFESIAHVEILQSQSRYSSQIFLDYALTLPNVQS